MIKNFKALKQEIEKLAKAPPLPPTGYVPEQRNVPSPNVPSNTVNKPVARLSGNSEVKNMQTAIINLAKDVTSQLNLVGLNSQDPRAKSEAGGRDSFADFIAKHFLRNSEVPAVEFSPDPKKTKMEEKDPRVASKLSWVMDTMNRIGHASSETFADGIWGPRTNAALHNIYAFTSGLFNLAEAFNVHSKFYNKEWLKNMKTGIPEKDTDFDATTKTEAASKLTKHINAIRKMYEEVRDKILQLPQYQTYIEADTPYLSHDKTGLHLTPQQLTSMKQTFAQGFSIPLNENGTKVATIYLDNLMSIEALNKWIKQFPDTRLDPYIVLSQVANQVSNQAKGA